MQFISVRSLSDTSNPYTIPARLTPSQLCQIEEPASKGTLWTPTALTLKQSPRDPTAPSGGIRVFVDTPWHGSRCF